MKKNIKSAKAELLAILRSPVLKRLSAGDILVTVLFLLIASISINLFRMDLLRTITLQNVEPVGYVVVRENIVQRRFIDRVLWDRLATESPVYLGDLIRVAPFSAATLYIEGNSIDLDENTLIRITRAPDGETLEIMMNEGNLSLATTAESRRVSISIGERQVLPTARTILNVRYAETGIRVQVNEGAAQFIDLEEEQVREIYAGTLISFDPSGIELEEIAAVVMQHPAFNARFINAAHAPFSVDFLWNNVRLDSDRPLRLEIASDRSFDNIIYTHENLDTQTQIAVGNGLWYWRLFSGNNTIHEGRFTIIDGAGQQLQSPVANTVFTYTEGLPILNFQWDGVSGAVSYILEVCNTPNFLTPQIQRHSQATFFTDSSLGPGTWYWRVKPLFPIAYTGTPAFSQVSHFRIEQAVIAQPIRSYEAANILAQAQEQPIPPYEPANIVAQAQAQAQPARHRETANIVAPTQPAQQPAQSHAVAQPQPVAQVTILPPPQNLQPTSGHRYTMSDLQTQRRINFSWQPVSGANAYILTIYRQVAGYRQQIYRTLPLTRTSYFLEDLRILDRGAFTWQVEAVSRGADNSITRRGIAAESTFIMDIILPGTIQIEGTADLFLPAPQNLQPPRGHRFTMSDLQVQRNINFSWQPVHGANAYIFTLFRHTIDGRQQIYRTEPMMRTSYLFAELPLLDRGTFIWQIEGVNMGAGNVIMQHGNITESTFIMDIILPGTIQIETTGALYEN
ncbi:MAG: hypothetical protein FWD87_01755 [Spirochaetaceae bacterium]|nr:hypothetical protein [Spirochaetaceae bacterium]